MLPHPQSAAAASPRRGPTTPLAESDRGRRILDAGIRVLAASGMRGLTHRAVDAAAGMPQGSCSAYLRTRAALLTALTEYVASQLVEDVARAQANILNAEFTPERAANEIVAMFVRWLRSPELLRARADLNQEALRNGELMQIVTSWRSGMTQLVTQVGEQLEFPDPVLRAATVVGALEGVLLSAQVMDEGDREGFIRASVPLLLRSLIADARRAAQSEPGA